MSVERVNAIAYKSPRSGRRYFSLDAACKAEAREIIKAKYPTDADLEEGYFFHWRDLNRSEVMHRRIVRLVKKAYSLATTEG